MQDQVTNKRNILLVDDEKTLTDMLAMLLQTRGYGVQIAYSGHEALQKVTPELDLIILDLILKDVSGFEVCRRLKENKVTRHIPIIILSAQSFYTDKVEGLYLGADDFLTKPCEYEELFARMEAVMRRGSAPASNFAQSSQDNVILSLRRILDQQLIVPYFQPIYLFNPMRILGAELLTRPVTTGLLANPEHFFREVLRFGLCAQMETMSWAKALPKITPFLTDHKIFLNCNPYFIETTPFSQVKHLFEDNGISPSHVILEITERSAISNFNLFSRHLKSYRQHGFGFAVDDVGGGYASLESIVETKPDVVKIDKQITQNLKDDPFRRSIIKFIISFCHENGIISIAEGIETQKDLQILMDMGVDGGQGFFLCRPIPELEVAKVSRPADFGLAS